MAIDIQLKVMILEQQVNDIPYIRNMKLKQIFGIVFLFALVFLSSCEQKPTWHFSITFDSELEKDEFVKRIKEFELPALKEGVSTSTEYSFDCAMSLDNDQLQKVFTSKEDYRLAEVLEIEVLYNFLPEELVDSVKLEFSGLGVFYRATVSSELLNSIEKVLAVYNMDGELPFFLYSEYNEEEKDYTLFLISKTKQVYLGKNIYQANLGLNSNVEPWFSLYFDPKGVEIIHEITENNLGKPLAIILFDKVVMAPIIKKKIKGEVLPLASDISLKMIFSKLFFGDIAHQENITYEVIKY